MPHLPYDCGTMPASNPRLSVVLTPSLFATLQQLAAATDQSASSIVRDLLLQTEPALRRMLALVLAANGAREQIGDGVGSTLFRVVEDLERELERKTGGEFVYQDLVDQAEALQGRAARASGAGERKRARAVRPLVAEGETPVPVTRGSGTGKPRRKDVRGGSV